MLFTAHIADVGFMTVLRNPAPTAAGLLSGRTATAAPFVKSKLPRPQLRRGLFLGCWQDEAAVDRWLGHDALGQKFSAGWHVRMELVRAVGIFPGLPDLDLQAEAGGRNRDLDGPTLALTIGTAYKSLVPRFIKVNNGLEEQFVDNPGMWGTAMTNLRSTLVATLTIWQDKQAALDYMRTGAHGQAVRDHYDPTKDPTGHTFVTGGGFLGFKPLSVHGSIGGRNPLSATLLQPTA